MILYLKGLVGYRNCVKILWIEIKIVTFFEVGIKSRRFESEHEIEMKNVENPNTLKINL